MAAADEPRGTGVPTDSIGHDASAFVMGAQVVARDGACGTLSGAVIDPVANAVTHLVVESERHRGLGHLVPVDLVESSGGEIHLRCTTAEFRALDEAEEVQLVPVPDDERSPAWGQTYMWPYYGLGMLTGGMGAGGMGEFEVSHHHTPQPTVADRVPLGEVEVRRGDRVHATDGWIGSVAGLVIDPADHHVTHVLLSEGHLFGRKQVAIPIKATARVGDEIRVNLTKQEVGELPAVSLSQGP
jgi:sporulation protein YlmC with PRC-barrel domain